MKGRPPRRSGSVRAPTALTSLSAHPRTTLASLPESTRWRPPSRPRLLHDGGGTISGRLTVPRPAVGGMGPTSRDDPGHGTLEQPVHAGVDYSTLINLRWPSWRVQPAAVAGARAMACGRRSAADQHRPQAVPAGIRRA